MRYSQEDIIRNKKFLINFKTNESFTDSMFTDIAEIKTVDLYNWIKLNSYFSFTPYYKYIDSEITNRLT